MILWQNISNREWLCKILLKKLIYKLQKILSITIIVILIILIVINIDDKFYDSKDMKSP